MAAFKYPNHVSLYVTSTSHIGLHHESLLKMMVFFETAETRPRRPSAVHVCIVSNSIGISPKVSDIQIIVCNPFSNHLGLVCQILLHLGAASGFSSNVPNEPRQRSLGTPLRSTRVR